jgi:multiple antibiotic resistance protein
MHFETFFLSFIPLFVAFDAIGIVPLYLGLTEGIDAVSKKKLILKASLTAFILCILFFLVGDVILRFMGITVNDFRIAGGIILLVISINDLLSYTSRVRDIEIEDIGIVPIGIPLIAGPAALTTILISNNEYGYMYTILSLVLNMIIIYLALRNAELVKRLLRDSGSKAFAKVASLFLAAIAVMMIRVGIVNSLQ